MQTLVSDIFHGPGYKLGLLFKNMLFLLPLPRVYHFCALIPVVFISVSSCDYRVFPKQWLLIYLGTPSVEVERILKYSVDLGSKRNILWPGCPLQVFGLLS